MYPDSVSRVHFLFVLIYGKSGFFIKFVKTYSISIKWVNIYVSGEMNV